MRTPASCATILSFLLSLSLSGIALADPVTFAIDGAGGKDTVTFTSKAPFENVVGRTNKVSGTIQTDLADLSKTKADIVVDLASLDTGIDMRDEHMRSDKYLDVKKFPNATFVLKSAKPSKKAIKSGENTKAKVSGDLSIHGVTKPISFEVNIAFVAGDPKSMFFQKDTLGVSGSMPIKLTDYGVKIPEMLVLKMSNDVRLDFSVQAAKK